MAVVGSDGEGSGWFFVLVFNIIFIYGHIIC